jgi:A/G-specific adenine glycosylase
MVCIENTRNEIFLEQRSAKGIWAGLYCFPTFSNEELCDQFINAMGAKNVQFVPVITHALTHKELSLHVVKLSGFSKQKVDKFFSNTLQNVGHWMSQEQWSGAGVPAPIRKVLIATAAH